MRCPDHYITVCGSTPVSMSVDPPTARRRAMTSSSTNTAPAHWVAVVQSGEEVVRPVISMGHPTSWSSWSTSMWSTSMAAVPCSDSECTSRAGRSLARRHIARRRPRPRCRRHTSTAWQRTSGRGTASLSGRRPWRCTRTPSAHAAARPRADRTRPTSQTPGFLASWA